MLKKILYAFTIFLAFGIIAYTAAWFYFAGVIDNEVRRFIAQQEEIGVKFVGPVSYPTGYPGKYLVRFSGDLVLPDATITLPLLQIRGIPVEGEVLEITAPMGVRIENTTLHPDLKNIEAAALAIRIPTKLPQLLSEPRVKIWQREGNAKLEIPSLMLQWPDASLFGDVVLGLNDDLQLEGQAQVGVVNYTYFLNIASDLTEIDDQKKFLITTFLGALDKAHGAVSLPFYIRENALYLNMIRLSPVPFIAWPPEPETLPAEPAPSTDNPPARPE